MKNFLKGLLIITVIGLILYAAYLFYVKFFKCCDECCNDLEEGDEECCCRIAFADRVKAAAERQLSKVK